MEKIRGKQNLCLEVEIEIFNQLMSVLSGMIFFYQRRDCIE